MAVKTTELGVIRLSGNDALKFTKQVNHGKPKAAASTGLERGRQLLKEYEKKGYAAIKEKEQQLSEAAPNSHSQDQLVLRELRDGDNVTKLSLGDKSFIPLKAFLKKNAKYYHKNNLAKTYVLAQPDNNIVVGYLTLICSQIILEEDKRSDIQQYQFNEFPAIKIARLAIDKNFKDNGYGRDLVSMAIVIAEERIMPHVGCRFLVVDAKSTAIKFYEKNGFTLLDTKENIHSSHPVLFIDLNKL